MQRRPPTSPRFPYTTVFRSEIHRAEAASALRSRKPERAAKEKPTPISQFFLAPAAPWHPNSPPRPGEAPHPAPSARKSATQTAQKTALCDPCEHPGGSESENRPATRGTAHSEVQGDARCTARCTTRCTARPMAALHFLLPTGHSRSGRRSFDSKHLPSPARRGSRSRTASPPAPQICTAARPCIIPPEIGSSVNVPGGTKFVTKSPDGSIAITGSTSDNINARVPVQFLGLANSRGFFQGQEGNSIYHSLQATLSHQFSGGVYFQGAYTWSKAIDNSSGSIFGDELNGLTQYGDYLNSRANRGPADFDRTHRLVVSYNYELPFAKFFHIDNHGLGKIVHGWSINGVTTFQSRSPITVFDGGAVTLQDTDGVNTTNFALLAPGATLASANTSGSIQSPLGDYLNLGAFASGGTCVTKQNAVAPLRDPT